MMSIHRCFPRLVIGLLLGLAAAGLAHAQDDVFPTGLAQFRFNFINPGARATGMGGAFIAQGNDATGSEINPAGLLFLPKSCFLAEYRYFQNITDKIYTADEARLIGQKFKDGVNSPTFLSFVYLLPPNWALAVYRQELANFRSNTWNEDYSVPNTDHYAFVINRVSNQIDFRLTNYGFTFARKIREDFNIGVSVRAAHLTFKGLESLNLDENRETPPGFRGYIKYNSVPPNGIGDFMTFNDSDWRFSFVLGIQYQPSNKITLAAVYRYGETHKLKTVWFNNIVDNSNVSLRQEYDHFEINVPDRIGGGLTFKPTVNLTINADVVYITYADLNDQFREVLKLEYRPFFGWKNGTEFRMGAEYAFPFGQTKNHALLLRAGWCIFPDPSIHYLGGTNTNNYKRIEFLFPILYPAVGTDYLYTGGVGLSLANRLQLDVAAEFGRTRRQVAVSVMYYLK